MSGHSKWSGIKHKKAIVDAKRGKAFSKVIREITVAAKMGGGSPDTNPRLRLVVQKAREVNLPKETLEKAIKRGTGDLPGVSYDEMTIEGYGPGGVAIMVSLLTDNKNRTSAEIRNIFTKHEGNMAGAGSVSWLFQKKGMVTCTPAGRSEDELLEIVLDAGAEDLKLEGSQATVVTASNSLEPVKQALQKSDLKLDTAELMLVPSSTMRVDDAAKAKALLGLLDVLEDQDDSQHVYANFDMPDEILTEYAGG